MRNHILRLTFITIGLLLFGLPLFISQSRAQEKLMPIRVPPPSYKQPLFFGETHYYSVYLRGNGEAVVSLRVLLSSISEGSIKTLTYELPSSQEIRDVVALEQLYRPQKSCYPYLPNPPYPLSEPMYKEDGSYYYPTPTAYPITPTPGYSESSKAYPVPNDDCYTDYSSSSYIYKKASVDREGDRLKITLPNPTSSNESTTLLLSYRTSDFTSEDLFQVYRYEFKTLKTDNTISSLQVGISTEQDYVLKGGSGSVGYNQGLSTSLRPSSFDSDDEIRSYQLDDFINNIGYGSLTKYASNLSPMETYTVKGAYAKSLWRLYGKEVLIGALVLLFLLAVIIIIAFIMIKKIRSRRNVQPATDQHALLSSVQKSFLITSGVSFFTSLFATIHTLLIFFLYSFVINKYSYDYTFNTLLSLMILVFSLGVYFALLIAPSYIIGTKRGLVWGVLNFVATFLWLLVYFIVAIVIVYFMLNTGNSGYPYKY